MGLWKSIRLKNLMCVALSEHFHIIESLNKFKNLVAFGWLKSQLECGLF